MYEVNSKRNKNNKKNWNEWVEKGGKMHFCPACFFLVVIFHSCYEMRKISSMRNRSDTHAQRRRRWYYRPGARTPQHKRDRAHSHQVQRFNAKTLCIRTDTMVVKCPYRQQLVRLHFSHWHSGRQAAEMTKSPTAIIHACASSRWQLSIRPIGSLSIFLFFINLVGCYGPLRWLNFVRIRPRSSSRTYQSPVRHVLVQYFSDWFP